MKKCSIMLLILAFISGCTNSNSKTAYNFKKADQAGVAAKFNDVTITEEELNKGLEAEIYEAELKIFELKYQKLKTVVLNKLVEKEAANKKISNDEYIEKNIVSKATVTDADIAKFVDKLVKENGLPKEQVNDEIKGRVKGYLLGEKKKEVLEKWVADKVSVDVFLNKPRRPTFNVEAGNAPFMGASDAKVTIVEFSDFQCPFCSKAVGMLKEVKNKYKDKVKVVFKQFPLPMHPQAEVASVASLCANEQSNDAFWKFHDEIFAHQDALSNDQLKAVAKKLNLKQDEFNKCLDENKFLAQVKSDIAQGESLGIRSTPTFFVNGQLLRGAGSAEDFFEVIDEELKK